MSSGQSFSLAAALRTRTQALHARAERSGVVRALLAGTADRAAYALLLRNLLPAYQALEAGLDRHVSALPGFARPELYRADAIATDLAALSGPDWRERLPLLPAGSRYAHRVTCAGAGDGMRLIAHAYARYLGDLSGGQVLRRRLATSLDLGSDALNFLSFPEIPDVAGFKAEFRDALDSSCGDVTALAGIVAEAAVAFRLNIQVAEAVQLATERVRAPA
jgi:heme oxygenase